MEKLGAVESQQAVAVSSYVPLSLAQLRDCMPGAGSCDADATANDVFNYIQTAGGIDTAATYPQTTGECQFSSAGVGAEVSGTESVTSGDEEALLQAVSQGPVAVTIDASHMSFQLYTGGIYSDPMCSSTRLDHQMLLVGYGVDDAGSKYWICQNRKRINEESTPMLVIKAIEDGVNNKQIQLTPPEFRKLGEGFTSTYTTCKQEYDLYRNKAPDMARSEKLA